ncbi:spore germination protein [Thalassorhabdus alkalitolerans]|uniref:Spore germination protein n=1 Tax=Thalassorhabdus alkalitolerans TaxID=2282697 RepID=A0ABW0YUG0_9BACI
MKKASLLDEQVEIVKKGLNDTDDLMCLSLPYFHTELSVMFLETRVKRVEFEKQVLDHLKPETKIADVKAKIAKTEWAQTKDLSYIITRIAEGYGAVIIEGEDKALLFDVSQTPERDVEEPVNEQVIRGSHAGFVESLDTNLNLLRVVIKNPDLTVKFYKIGERTGTKVAIVYINGLAKEELLTELAERITSIKADAVNAPSFTEEFIEDEAFTPFPQFLNTERIDRVTGNLLEGRVAVMSDGSPTALICPTTFWAFYQSPDDYNSRWMMGTSFRLLRLLSFLISVSLPALYISIVSFHFEVIPEGMTLMIKESIDQIPYPPLIEAFIMEITIELIREAGIRLPSPVGQTIGIVGGLVIGDAVVNAGFVSNVMIIVVAITAIASFVVPNNEMSMSVRVLRFPLMLAAAAFGLIGIVFGLTLILIHMCGLRSFGTPYLSPLAPLSFTELKDSVIRGPLWKMNTRPFGSQALDKTRQGK